MNDTLCIVLLIGNRVAARFLRSAKVGNVARRSATIAYKRPENARGRLVECACYFEVRLRLTVKRLLL